MIWMRWLQMRNEGLYIYPSQGCFFIRDMTFHMSCLFVSNNYLLIIYIYTCYIAFPLEMLCPQSMFMERLTSSFCLAMSSHDSMFLVLLRLMIPDDMSDEELSRTVELWKSLPTLVRSSAKLGVYRVLVLDNIDILTGSYIYSYDLNVEREFS